MENQENQQQSTKKSTGTSITRFVIQHKTKLLAAAVVALLMSNRDLKRENKDLKKQRNASHEMAQLLSLEALETAATMRQATADLARKV